MLPPVPDTSIPRSTTGAYGQIPLSFIANQGQWHPSAHFRTLRGEADTWFTNSGIRTAIVGQTVEDFALSEAERSTWLEGLSPIERALADHARVSDSTA